MTESPDRPDETGETPDRVVPPEECKACSNDPAASGLCIECFLA